MDNRHTQYIELTLKVKLILAITAVLLFSIALNTTLNYLNFEKRLNETSDSTYQIVVEETHSDINQAVSLGLSLASISNIQAILERRIQLVEGITYIAVRSDVGDVLFSTGETTNQPERKLSVDLYNTFDVKEGKLELHYATAPLNQTKQSLLSKQILIAVFWLSITLGIGFIAIRHLLDIFLKKIDQASQLLTEEEASKEETLKQITKAHQIINASSDRSKWMQWTSKHFPLVIIGIAVSLTFIANVGLSYQSMNAFSSVYESKLEQKSNLIGDTLSSVIHRLIENGVPIDKLNGLEEEFSNYTQTHDEILHIALFSGREELYQYPTHSNSNGRTHVLALPDESNIQLEISTNDNIILNLIKESFMDMVTVLIASCLVVIEIVLFTCHFLILAPWHQLKQVFMAVNRDIVNHLAAILSKDEIGGLLKKVNIKVSQLNPTQPTKQLSALDYRFIRLPLFLLVFAEASSLAFFPNFVASLPNNLTWIPKSLETSIPISLFMLCWAISLPFAGYWSDKVGRRKSLIAGACLTAIGLTLTAFVPNMLTLLIARAVTAVGYGIVFISAQGYVTDTTNDGNRTKGMATFLSAFFSGSLCGAAIGGIMADKLGYSTTFLSAAILALLSALLVMLFFAQSQSQNSSKPVQLSDFKILLTNKYFALICVLSAIPAKIVLTGFLYYICPVYLQYLGESSSMSGRIMMTYGLSLIIISPLSAALVDKYKNKLVFIVCGGLLSAIALINILILPGTYGLLMIVIIIGVAHGICVSPQIPLVIELLRDQGLDKGKTIGIFRLIERIGNVAGPILAGFLLSLFGFETTILIFGVTLLCSSVVLMALYSLFVKNDKQQLEVTR
ncbi:MFS transporter [Vibrio sp. 10N.261.55.A7]|uniref:MFS transporter n=1 Tax=Vibrio sp. 10N.261.55.A7 TaxID=1880851 RepID=UPI000C830C15|nr:MFS transporter [Vibrio sp. 10N.261.55.A7]PMJ92439.1 transporter [Vibrio sp. 10N.261.55.A7]